MFCGKCGAEIKPGMEFCPNCGNSLNVPHTAEEQKPAVTVESQNASPAVKTSGSCGWAGINVFAVIGFTLAFCLGIPGLVFSIMGYQEGERTGKQKGLAIAGIVISIINIILTIIAIAAVCDYVLDNSKKTYYPYL